MKQSKDLRVIGAIRRGSEEWKTLFGLRQSVERIFKNMKRSRRLERHCLRGLRKISLPAVMSALGYAATYHVNLQARELRPDWMVRKVA